MGIADDYAITSHLIEQACLFSATAGGPLLAVAILTIAEAARSQVVYQVMQQLLQSPARQVQWGEIVPLLRVWGEYTTDHHKRKPKVYGALGVRDYYEDGGAVGALQKRGFTIDA